MKKLLIALVLLSPAAAFAQPQTLEITPTIAYHFAGDFDLEYAFVHQELEVDEGEAYGLTLGIPLGSIFHLEFLARQQSTELSSDGGLFGVDEELGDLDIDYYHVGALFQFDAGRVHPYFVASAGLARLDFELPNADREDQPSASLGGGIKLYLSENVGLRFEGRAFYVDLDDGGRDRDDRWEDENSITQAEASVGLIIGW